MASTDLIRSTLVTLLGELSRGASPDVAWVLNPGDPGLLASLDRLPAAAASASPGGRSSIAAHVDHLRYGLSLVNRWAGGEADPFSGADYAASWQRQSVTDEEWRALRADLETELDRWRHAVGTPRDWDEVSLTGTLASIVHLAYHLGAIRQLDAALHGPKARD